MEIPSAGNFICFNRVVKVVIVNINLSLEIPRNLRIFISWKFNVNLPLRGFENDLR